MYDETIDKLSKDKEYYINQLEYLGLSEKEIEFLEQVNDGTIHQGKAKNIAHIMRDLKVKKEWSLTEDSVVKFWKKHSIEVMSHFDKLKSLAFRPIVTIKSKIVEEGDKEVEILDKMIPRKVKNYRLLYRAS